MGAPAGPTPFRNGEYWTGDAGMLDPAGFLYLRGRKDSMINVGGLKVAPDEVRAALERHPAVREAAVVGVQDTGGEEVVYAVVAAREPVAEEELIAFCRAELAEYKVPRRIELRAELPRGPTGKVRLRAEDVRG
jgi:long-chain acyl-CoA synthetase